jgi:hypothetical protein
MSKRFDLLWKQVKAAVKAAEPKAEKPLWNEVRVNATLIRRRPVKG